MWTGPVFRRHIYLCWEGESLPTFTMTKFWSEQPWHSKISQPKRMPLVEQGQEHLGRLDRQQNLHGHRMMLLRTEQLPQRGFPHARIEVWGRNTPKVALTDGPLWLLLIPNGHIVNIETPSAGALSGLGRPSRTNWNFWRRHWCRTLISKRLETLSSVVICVTSVGHKFETISWEETISCLPL